MKSLISELLGTSPVAPLQKHIKTVYECACLLPKLVAAANAGDWETAKTLHEKIAELENAADRLKFEIRSNLPKSLFMPVPRQDLLELVLVQDKIANITRDVSGIIIGRKMRFPEEIRNDYEQFVELCVEAVGQAVQSVNELDELYETGFRGAEVELVEKMIRKLDETESKTDRLQSQIRRKLFAIEDDLPPVHVMFLYIVIEKTGGIADMAERVGRRLELLLAK